MDLNPCIAKRAVAQLLQVKSGYLGVVFTSRALPLIQEDSYIDTLPE
jgi:hypothetical protein